MLTVVQRVLYGIQTPVAILATLGVFVGIPSTLTAGNSSKTKSTKEKVLGIDYAGALILVPPRPTCQAI